MKFSDLPIVYGPNFADLTFLVLDSAGNNIRITGADLVAMANPPAPTPLAADVKFSEFPLVTPTNLSTIRIVGLSDTGANAQFSGSDLGGPGSNGTVTAVTGTAPIVITGTPTVAPNVTVDVFTTSVKGAVPAPNANPSNYVLSAAGTWVAPTTGGTGVTSVGAGTGIDVDSTDPNSPIVSIEPNSIGAAQLNATVDASLAKADTAVQTVAGTAPITTTGTTAKTIAIDTFTQTVKGAVPPPVSAPTGRYLSDSGVWTVLPSSPEIGYYNFDTSTADSDPGNGDFRLNAATRAAATFIYFDDLTSKGIDVRSSLLKATTNDTVYIQVEADASRSVRYRLTGPAVAATGYVKFPVSVDVAPTGAEFGNNEQCVLSFKISAISGGGGSTLPPDTTANQILTSGTVASGDAQWATRSITGLASISNAGGTGNIAEGNISLSLENDRLNPGPNMTYATDANGETGWYARTGSEVY